MASVDRLRLFLRRRRPVRLQRPFEAGFARGYLSAVGDKLTLMTSLGDGVRFEGFEVFRNRDIRELQEEPHSAFVATALRLRGEQRPARPPLRLDHFGTVLRGVARRFPLVTLEREIIDPGVCHIGRVVEVGGHEVTLQPIDPDARWIDGHDRCRLRDLTSVSFGGSYLEALHLVAAAAEG